MGGQLWLQWVAFEYAPQSPPKSEQSRKAGRIVLADEERWGKESVDKPEGGDNNLQVRSYRVGGVLQKELIMPDGGVYGNRGGSCRGWD